MNNDFVKGDWESILSLQRFSHEIDTLTCEISTIVVASSKMLA